VIVIVLVVVVVALAMWFRKAATSASSNPEDRIQRVIAEDKKRESGTAPTPGARGSGTQGAPIPAGGR